MTSSINLRQQFILLWRERESPASPGDESQQKLEISWKRHDMIS